MVNKVAFIIPTYPPHFNYAKNFLDTFRKNYLNLQADLFFIFSNESEAQEFGEYEYKIILPDELRIFENGGIINIKKFFALKSLQNQYDYYIVLDSESEIIKNVDLYSICNSIYETKKLYGNTVWNFEHIGMCKIREQCKSHFKSNENFSTLAEKEKDLYLWFSNLPVYKNELTFIEIPQGYVGWREHSDSESTKGILTCFTEWKRLALLMANELQECGILNKKEIKRVLKKSEKCRIKRIIKDYEKNKKNFKLPQDVLFKYYWKLLLKFIYSKEKQPASHRIIYRILGFKISKKSTKNYKKCSIKNSKVPLIIDGDFYNLKNFPIKAKNYQLQSDAYTIPSLCIVIQGPIVKENDFTLETCKIYKKIFNNSETIILSTWDTEDKKYLKNFEAIGVKVLLSKAPDFAGRANLNYQILSTMKGLKEGEKLGCEYAIKTRTDQRFYSTNLSRDLFNLLKIYPPSPNYNMHSRLVALSFNSFKYRYYGISDMFLFGNTQDMLKYWNSPLDTKKYEEYKTIKQKDLWQQYCSETYIALHFLKNIGVTPEYTLKHTWKIYKDLFIFIDKEILDMYWPKYTNLNSRWRLFRPNMLEEMRHSDWLNLYLNDDFFIKEDIELLIPNIGEN